MRAEFLPGWARGLPWLPIVLLAAVGVCAAAGEWIMPYDPNELDLGAAFNPPPWQEGGTLAYALGADNLGRDILSRIMAGSKTLPSALTSSILRSSLASPKSSIFAMPMWM